MELAERAAEIILNYFKNYRRDFKDITRKAPVWFEARDWGAAQKGLAERHELYGGSIVELNSVLRTMMGPHYRSRDTWISIKDSFGKLIANRNDEEIAETYFNSVTRSVHKTEGVDREREFVWFDAELLLSGEETPIFRRYYRTGSTHQLIRSILEDYRFKVDYQDVDRDAGWIAEEIEKHLKDSSGMADFDVIEVVEPLFYRNKAAYMLGRIRRGNRIVPLVVPMLNAEEGILVDTVLLQEKDVSTVFSYTRSYFMIDVERPAELVGFLKSLLPMKPLAEMYISLGYIKHGKTVHYRYLYRHLAQSTDRFEFAKGAKGMVMVVFTLPSYDWVFKVIRDKFAAPKTTTRAKVLATYKLVFDHDRVGRLVDAQAFERLSFDLDRFSPELLKELTEECSESVSIVDGKLVIDLLYINRRVHPLNLYAQEVGIERAKAAVIDHGQSIKDMAASGIFPGDLLVKNFGVTARGRVVFYDYDEICSLDKCNFRHLPQGSYEEGFYGEEPNIVVDEMDIFPAEFRYFLWSTPHLRKVMEEHHGDLFTVEYWRDLQRRHKAGELPDVFPYPKSQRFCVIHGTKCA